MRQASMTLIAVLTTALMMAWAVPVMAGDALKVNINEASVEELITLDGIGEAYAKRIIEFRDKNGPFQKPEDLLKIKGIGEKILIANQDRIILSNQ